MKKITKKTAALTAAVMALTTLGSMSVYAESNCIEGTETEPNQKSATIKNYAKLEELYGGSNIYTYANDGTDDSNKYVWHIDIEGSTHTFIYEAEMAYEQKYTVKWNPETLKYDRVYGEKEKRLHPDGNIYTTNGESTKLTNKSNFIVSYDIEVTSTDLGHVLEENGAEYETSVNEHRFVDIGRDEYIYYTLSLRNLSEVQKTNILNALLNAGADKDPVALFDYTLTFTPQTIPGSTLIPFMEGGEYDTGNLPE